MTRNADTHENFSRAESPAMGGARGFGLVFAGFFAIVGLWPLTGGDPVRSWALVVAVVFLLVALVRPALLQPLNRIWFRFGLLLGHVVSPIFLGLVFYFSVVPVGLMMRLLGKDPLRLKRAPDRVSYWIERRPPGPTGDSLRNQF